MIKKWAKIIFYFSCLFNKVYSQEMIDLNEVKYTSTNKGKFFFYWGGNRANYSESDITFSGNDYNVTFSDVKARDRPKGYHIDYINPKRLTNPQTNARVGYFITDHYKVSIGLDHMKYVVNQNQQVRISGAINLPQNQEGSYFNGDYYNESINLTTDLLIFEHTDALNYINAGIARMDDISQVFGIRNIDIVQINLTEGISGGVLYPKTNATVLASDRNDEFHVSGYGVSFNGGLNITFLKYFFVQAELKGGYIDMNDIRTTQFDEDRAAQDFFFLERIIAVGGIFRL